MHFSGAQLCMQLQVFHSVLGVVKAPFFTTCRLPSLSHDSKAKTMLFARQGKHLFVLTRISHLDMQSFKFSRATGHYGGLWRLHLRPLAQDHSPC